MFGEKILDREDASRRRLVRDKSPSHEEREYWMLVLVARVRTCENRERDSEVGAAEDPGGRNDLSSGLKEVDGGWKSDV